MPQQLAEAKEAAQNFLPETRSEYAIRNPNKFNNNYDGNVNNNDTDDEELYNDPYQNPIHVEDCEIINISKCCKDICIYLPTILIF